MCWYKNTICSHPAMKTDLSFWGSWERTELFASCWMKITIFPLSEKGQRARWIAGLWGRSLGQQVNGWQMFPDIRLYFCDCKLGEELLPLPPQIPARNVSSVSMWWILSFTLEITMGFPVSNFYPNQMAWVYRTRGPVHAWASSTTHSVDLSLHVKGFSDSHSFIAVGFLGAPRWSRRLSCYQEPGANRVKAVILESWWGGGEGGSVHGVYVREIDSQLPVQIRALLRISVLSQHQR